jgi:pilus assembly protein CpaB
MRRPMIFVLLAGVAALVAAIVVYSALKKREAQVQDAMVRSVNVLVAARDLPIGSKLDASAVKLVRWSRDAMPPGAYTDAGAVLNQFTKTGFVQNEPIVADRLFSGDKNAGVLPLLIPNGMRAVSVPVDEVSDIAGFVSPHSHVDLLVSVATTAGSNQPFSKIVLQNVEVLATAQEIENTGADKAQVVRVVTLLVTPEEAERVVLASREGQLRLAMRNYDDKKIVATSGVNVPDLLRSYGAVPVEPQQAAVAAPIRMFTSRARPVQVEILRNGKSIENVSFVHGHSGSSDKTEPETSTTDHSDKVAAAPGADPTTEAGVKSAGIAGPGSSLAAKAALSAATANGDGADQVIPKSPHAKAIDIP